MRKSWEARAVRTFHTHLCFSNLVIRLSCHSYLLNAINTKYMPPGYHIQRLNKEHPFNATSRMLFSRKREGEEEREICRSQSVSQSVSRSVDRSVKQKKQPTAIMPCTVLCRSTPHILLLKALNGLMSFVA
jgi:hypothetical protein